MIRWIDEVKAVPWAPPQVRTLMISAGHSHTDPGAVANGYREADLVLEFRDLVSIELCALGIKHMKDGGKGENLPLRDAVKVAAKCDLAVEFHTDAAGSSATGTWTLSRAHNKPLAAQLCHVTADTLGIRNRGPAPENAGQHHRLAFVSDGGGIIHELFFITNKGDLAAFLGGRRGLAKEVARVLAEAARQP
ncbi:N-acetylmuramoyl-L-alanine amidase [Halomonas daqingensis]|uniref:N-acetylmuramoyl-L-alanine amidase n=1 Tax=Billgrantia desiderata TaxID=52021 RepID=A0ABS9B4B0_9GAMM|nr:N-acetylmuramoyl-L-alanine amidase [Halomonas desiderata]MCE8042452.1 N-acetylmuramoyl-L-alanine amidase [Halomonas desiderata]MCE8047027.1 N-acetylmuramoyl-L-alanine amidase [Halomonas desiderata]